MNTISNILNFKFTWRNYQQKFLDNFDTHISDKHLHVVAPPGSGKTILGLEILKRVNQATLVLSPSLTIRNQWKDRMLTFFLEDDSFVNYSTNIKKPKQITFATYQALYALHKDFNKEDNSKTLIGFIQQNGIKTVVLDEAHHLKNEWWKCLFEIKKAADITIISLTATPPYDSESNEVKKYFDLCGPIDDEIVVPDLIKNGDLCPHQDYVYFSKPEEAQIKYIIHYRENILNFINNLVADQEFVFMLQEHSFYKNTEVALENIYSKPLYYSSIIVFLNAAQIAIPKEKITLLGFKDNKIKFPLLNYDWLTILLQELLVVEREQFPLFEEKLLAIEKDLRKIGAFEKKRVDFIGIEHLYRTLANSPSKLKGINTIIRAEGNSLGDTLRAVILTDFIRQEFLSFTGNNTKELNKLGVVSIFQYLRTQSNHKEQLAVLTGSIVILHKKAIINLKKIVNDSEFTAKPLEVDTDFVVITAFVKGKNTVVAAVTELFENGTIKVLVGTKALLGEGWDAPAMNTLVLATYVGSFVSSNQMRGRAIRTQAGNKNKTANIWHLACIDPTDSTGGKDLEQLIRRFSAFKGVSLKGEPYILNGIDRLDLPEIYKPEINLDTLNKETFSIAKQRNTIAKRWEQAISKGAVFIRELKVLYSDDVPYPQQKKLRSVNAAKYLLLEIVVGIFALVPEFILKNLGVLLSKGLVQMISLFFGVIFLGFVPKAYKALKLYFLFGNMERKTKDIANAVLKSLVGSNKIATPSAKIRIVTERQPNGVFECYIIGATTNESSLFISILEEIIAPVENPKYLIDNSSWLKRKWNLRTFYVVPAIFSKQKEEAKKFHFHWKEYVGNSSLIYTRTRHGRKLLVKAKMAHIFYQFKEASKQTITWR
ncbi:DEAD/DEAH box helicase family protein [Cellulophaga sp. F20128]|uniref:DEAD/DEAH box helicase family protein n=1 Tax=Cellulophaga sp. F20128 TaxID=2926413 RepID=UPI001FF3C51C|nr:DEAD/DEAH box helicase family protein [Cellulophaga sp. F20128]MCK0155889.1 DEAD/DEAH box helicase family protein [Cellulophaga sp. F20128]